MFTASFLKLKENIKLDSKSLGLRPVKLSSSEGGFLAFNESVISMDVKRIEAVIALATKIQRSI